MGERAAITPSGRFRFSRAIRAGLALLSTLVAPFSMAAQEASWDGAGHLSGNALFGSARTRVVSTGVEASRTDSTLAVRSAVRIDYADDREVDAARRVTARALLASLGVDYRPLDRVSPFVLGSGESNYQQRIAWRYNAGVGAKLTLLRKNRDDLSVSLALLHERTRALAEDDTAGGTATRTRWSLRFRFRRPLSPSLYFSHVTFYQPSITDMATRYTVDAATSLEAAINSVLSFTATLRDRYDSEATARGATSNNDGQFLVGVLAKF